MSITQQAKEEVKQLLVRGQKSEAIQHLKDTFQISDEEAKTLVDALEREQETSGGSAFVSALTGGLKTQVTQLLLSNKKMEAIRLVRTQTGAQLKTALDLVENVQKEINPNFKRAGGCVGSGFKIMSIFFYGISFLLLGGAGLTYYYEEESIKKSDLVTGKVAALEPNHDSDGTDTYAPVVSYTWNGQEKTYRSTMYSYPPAYEVGEEVQLFVNREEPEKVYINSFSDRWLPVTILGGLGCFLLIFAIIMSFASRKVK